MRSLASSYNRKSNSSASRAAKPTYRRAKSAKPAKPTASKAAAPKTKAPKGKVASPVRSAAAKASAPRKKTATRKLRPSVPTRPAAPAKATAAKARRAAASSKDASPRAARARGGASVQGSGRTTARAASTPAFVSNLPFARIALAFAGIAIVAIVAWVVITTSPIFSVTDVVVRGSEHVPQAMAERLIDVPEGTTLFNVDTASIEESLKQNPWVESVQIERQFPHTLIITPQEYEVAAIAYITSGDVAWAIGTNNTWIAPISLSVTVDAEGNIVSTTGETQGDATAEQDGTASAGEDGTAAPDGGGSGDDAGGDAVTAGEPATPEDAQGDVAASDGSSGDDASGEADEVSTTGSDGAQDGAASDGTRVLTGLEAALVLAQQDDAILFINIPADVAPDSGSEVTSDVIVAGLAYSDGFSTEFIGQIEDLSLESVDAISANLTSGVEVSLGSPENIALKERVVTELLDQVEGITYINVRDPENPTYRAL